MLTSELLATHVQSVSIEELSSEVIEVCERLLIDSIGCSLGASDAPPVEKLRALYGSHEPNGYDATVFGSDIRVPAEYAALINGVMVRYLDFNDDYQGPRGGCHPSDQIPVLLAVAEAEGASGEELIEAMAVGYEVQCGGIETSSIRPKGWDYVTWGVHGATAGVGKLMGLSTDELVNAFGMAVTANNALGVTRRGSISMWKGVAQAFGCHNAIHACQMAREGITGPRAAYEGEHGFFDVVAKQSVTFEYLSGETDDKITKTNFKPYSACYPTLPSVDAILTLMEKHEFDANDVQSIDVEIYTKGFTSAGTPEKWSRELTRETADHSLAYVASIAMLEGEVMPRHYEPGWLADERVHELMGKISVAPSDELDQFKLDHPQSIPARMVVQTTDGTYEARVDYPKGHAKNPVSNAEIEAKMRELARPYLSDEQIQATIDQCYDVATLDDVGVLVRNLAGFR